MRIAYYSLPFALCLMAFSGLMAQTAVQVITGPTSFTGASNLEDGIQIASTGAYSTQFALNTQILPFCSADAEVNWGSLGLTAADRRSEISEWQGIGAGLRIHKPFDRNQVLQPWFGIGVNFLQQSNFEDLTDANGLTYYHWSDGRVYDMSEDEPHANVLAQELTPDYSFESETFTKQGIAVPIRFGLNMNVSPRVYASAAMSILAGAEASLDPRPGLTDYLTTAQAGIGIRLGKEFAQPKIEYPEGWADLGDDYDQDGIKDKRDRCPNSPANVAIDKCGCPIDSDQDGIADYLDQEPFSPHKDVNAEGVALSPEQWEAHWAHAAEAKGTVIEVFQRVETDYEQNAITPVDANGRTPAELRLLKTFGGEKSTIPVKAKKSSDTSNRTEVPGESVIIEANLDEFRSHMPTVRPGFRVQLADNVRTLDMNAVTPFLLNGRVTQKFTQSSAMTFVTPVINDLETAKSELKNLQAAGFEGALIVGDFNGKLIDVRSAELLGLEWNAEVAAVH